MATDKMGYRYTTKYFQKCYWFKYFHTIYAWIADIYEVNSVTIIADKGMSVNRNIRFLESKNWKYIISYRMKAGSKQFKEYVLMKRLCKWWWFDIQTRDIASSYNKKRINGHFRRQIISFSQKRATKDKNDRDILIQNFTKKMNKDNLFLISI
nr:transposase [Mycoplasmopsis bovis]